MAESIKIVKSTIIKMGKLLSGSKIRYDWEVQVDTKTLHFTFSDSRSSKIKRLFVNKIKIVEEKSRDPNYKLSIVFENNNFLIFNEKEIYRLSINGKILSKIPERVSVLPSTCELSDCEFVHFNPVTKIDGSIELSTNDPSLFSLSEVSFKSGSKTPSARIINGSKKSPLTNPAIIKAPVVYNALNCSGEFYDKTPQFLCIKEKNENVEMIKFVNGFK